jgi:hypothetical protein
VECKEYGRILLSADAYKFVQKIKFVGLHWQFYFWVDKLFRELATSNALLLCRHSI